MVHIWDVNWLGIKFQFQPLYGMFTNLRYHLGAPVPAPLTSPPTVNGPITVALVGKLSQIVGNLQFMIFPQINPSGTCFGEKLSTFWEQILKKSKKSPGVGCTTLFYDLTAWTGRILRPLYIIQHRSLWPLYITHTKLLPAFTLGVSQNHLVWFFYKGDKMAWQWEVNGAWRVLE